MNRRERLMASLRGEPVDRPAVNFYEVSGIDQDPANNDPFNIFSDSSWLPVLELAREKTDIILLRGAPWRSSSPDPLAELTTVEQETDANGTLFVTHTIRAGSRTLTSRVRRDPAINTAWTLEHYIKDVDDLKAWLDLPAAESGGEVIRDSFLATEKSLGDSGIVMLDTGDPICCVAPLFELGTFTVIATTEPELFHRALERAAAPLYEMIEAVAKALPERLWRICGPEYASVPYLRPDLFHEYVTRYDAPIVEAIQKHGGYGRIHCHGRLKDILDHIAETGCTGLDPIEPPGQGDVTLAYVREKYGKQMTLFGNLEASDLENLDTPQFEEKIRTALEEGTAGEGRGFVLMPSSCPYGRHIAPHVVRNYERMVEMVEDF